MKLKQLVRVPSGGGINTTVVIERDDGDDVIMTRNSENPPGDWSEIALPRRLPAKGTNGRRVRSSKK